MGIVFGVAQFNRCSFLVLLLACLDLGNVHLCPCIATVPLSYTTTILLCADTLDDEERQVIERTPMSCTCSFMPGCMGTDALDFLVLLWNSAGTSVVWKTTFSKPWLTPASIVGQSTKVSSSVLVFLVGWEDTNNWEGVWPKWLICSSVAARRNGSLFNKSKSTAPSYVK